MDIHSHQQALDAYENVLEHLRKNIFELQRHVKPLFLT